MSKKNSATKPIEPKVKPGVIAMSEQVEQTQNGADGAGETATAAITADVAATTSTEANTAPVTTPSASETTQVAAPVEEVKEDKPDTVYTFIAAKYPALSDKAKLPLILQSIIERLEAYVKGMGNNVPVTPSDGVKFQKSLYNCFNAALDAKDGQHVLVLDVICWYISKHRASAFSDRLAARFLDAEQFSNGVQGKFVSILNVLTIVSNPANRGKINKLVNMDSVSRTLNNTGLSLALSNYVAAAR